MSYPLLAPQKAINIRSTSAGGRFLDRPQDEGWVNPKKIGTTTYKNAEIHPAKDINVWK